LVLGSLSGTLKFFLNLEKAVTRSVFDIFSLPIVTAISSVLCWARFLLEISVYRITNEMITSHNMKNNFFLCFLINDSILFSPLWVDDGVDDGT
jgi:hypothetical protein